MGNYFNEPTKTSFLASRPIIMLDVSDIYFKQKKTLPSSLKLHKVCHPNKHKRYYEASCYFYVKGHTNKRNMSKSKFTVSKLCLK